MRLMRGRISGNRNLPIIAVMVGLVLLTALFLARLGLSAFDAFIRDAGKSADPTPMEVALGAAVAKIPANMLRSGGMPNEKLELYIHWPSLEGFSVERSALFQADAPDAPIIYMTIRQADKAMSPDERFRSVYPRVLAEGIREEADGIVVRSFQSGYGYDGEELLIARDAERPLAARCHAEAADASAIDCMAEFRTVSGFDVAYRFDRALTKDWRMLDTALRELVDSFFESGTTG